MPDSFDYTTGTNSENVRLLQALIDDAPEYTEETNSRNANILKSIINNTEYTDAPQSEIEELLLRLKAKIGGEIEVDELNVTENGTYDAGVNKAYNPVTVELPLNGKTITENGTYTASSDNLAGFNEVTVAVEGYAKKPIANTPTAIATFNASALPMPSLTVGIEAVQSGSGDPSPTNVRPISGFSAVNVYNLDDTDKSPFFKGLINGTFGYTDLGTIRWYKSGTSMFYGYLPTHKVVEGDAPINAISSNGMQFLQMLGGGNDEYIVINDSAYESYTAAQFKTAMNGVYLIYELATPTTPTITDEQFNSLLTAFGVSGTTYTTTLKDSQGNPMECYGGELSNVNGVQSLDNTMDKVALGSLGWSYIADSDYTNGGYFRSEQYTDMSNNTINILCDSYVSAGVQGKNAVINKYGASANNIIYTATGSSRLYILDSTYTDADQFKTYLQSANVQLVYELATPQTIPQDNLAIATQEGTNNLWADSGDVLSGEYLEAL